MVCTLSLMSNMAAVPLSLIHIYDWQKMKALNTLLYSFVRYPEELEAFAEDPPRMAAEWLRRSLQTM